jgi:hypothetical protein
LNFSELPIGFPLSADALPSLFQRIPINQTINFDWTSLSIKSPIGDFSI